MGSKNQVETSNKANFENDDSEPVNGRDIQNADDEPSVADTDQDLEERLETAQQEAAQSYDRFLRAAAELDNYKKRAMRDMEELRKYANENLLRDLLSVIDNLERAIESSADVESGDAGIVKGVDMTLKEIVKILEKNKVKAVSAVGRPFDPAYHQAFMTEESDEHPENTVLKEMQKGYILHDRLLRPAMVVVSKSKSTDASEAAAQATEES